MTTPQIPPLLSLIFIISSLILPTLSLSTYTACGELCINRIFDNTLCQPRTGTTDCLCYASAYYLQQVAVCISLCPNATHELDLAGETLHDNCYLLGAIPALTPQDFVVAGLSSSADTLTAAATSFDFETVPTSVATSHYLCAGSGVCSAFVINPSTTGDVPVYTPTTAGVVSDSVVTVTKGSSTITQGPITAAPSVVSSTESLRTSTTAPVSSTTSSGAAAAGNYPICGSCHLGLVFAFVGWGWVL